MNTEHLHYLHTDDLPHDLTTPPADDSGDVYDIALGVLAWALLTALAVVAHHVVSMGL